MSLVEIVNPFTKARLELKVKAFITEHYRAVMAIHHFTNVQATAWFFSEHPSLGGKMPVTLVENDEDHIVIDLIKDLIKRAKDPARIEDKRRADEEREKNRQANPLST